MAGEWKVQRTVGISDRACLWLDSERSWEAKKRSAKKKRYSSLHYANWIYSCRKISEKTPTFPSRVAVAYCYSQLLWVWTLTTGNFILLCNKHINSLCHQIVCSSANSLATQYFTFSFSSFLKEWWCLPLSSEIPFFLFQKSKPKYLKLKEGESGWKGKRQDRKQSQQAAA